MPPKSGRKDEAHGLSCGDNDEYISLGINRDLCKLQISAGLSNGVDLPI